MIAVIFEVELAAGQTDTYLSIAADLRPLLETIDGFISVERFQSLTDSDKILSLSFFRDEAAVREWRNLSEHRAGQTAGRSGVFQNYRLRVTQVIRDYGVDDREQAPPDSLDEHATR